MVDDRHRAGERRSVTYAVPHTPVQRFEPWPSTPTSRESPAAEFGAGSEVMDFYEFFCGGGLADNALGRRAVAPGGM